MLNLTSLVMLSGRIKIFDLIVAMPKQNMQQPSSVL